MADMETEADVTHHLSTQANARAQGHSSQMKRGRQVETQAAAPFQSLGPPEIDPSEVEPERLIGEGSFGKVMLGICRQKKVAVKVLHKQTFDQKALDAFRKEIAIVSRVYHPNITLFMGACTTPGKCMIVTEHVAKGDLETMLHDPSVNLSLTLRMKMARDAALGMNWLHQSNPKFIHRDLKTSNLLVDENMRVKVCDFGLSQMLSEGDVARDEKSAKGTPLWMAPEVMMFRSFTEKCDVYSFGIVLWEILTREEPFKEYTSFTEFRNAVCKKHERPKIPESTLPSLAQLIMACWQPDPALRPDFTQIISQLDVIIVESAIGDAWGRNFWRTNFLKVDPAPWPEFLDRILAFLQVPPELVQTFASVTAEQARLNKDDLLTLFHLNVECLKSICCTISKTDDKSDVVGLERFGRVLDCFAPVQGAPLLDDIRALLSERWFHGFISTVDAQNRLSGYPAGCFLVRFSSTETGSYTISLVTPENSIRHQRVKHVVGEGFYLHGQCYPSLQHVVTEGGHLLNLLIPAPGSKFQPLFNDHPQPVLGYEEVSAGSF